MSKNVSKKAWKNLTGHLASRSTVKERELSGKKTDTRTCVARVSRVDADGEPGVTCEGKVFVPETEDTVSLDDLLEAVKVHDLRVNGEVESPNRLQGVHRKRFGMNLDKEGTPP